METTTEIKDNFIQLLEGLNTGLIVLIDDDFRIAVSDPERLVSELICLDEKQLFLLLSKLSELNFTELEENLKQVINDFKKIPVDIENYQFVTQANKVIRYLDVITHPEKRDVKERVKQVISLLSESLNESTEVEKLLMRYGIGIINLKSYKEIVDTASTQYKRFYSIKPDSQMIRQDIEETSDNSQFCICIVDKLLQREDIGARFIKEELIQECHDKNIISILYSSQPKSTEPNELEDYFLFEVEKGHVDALKNLTNGLALCGYVELFNRFSDIYKNSIDEAFKLALERKDNMIYLAGMANEEGVTPFETISDWFQLATQYKMGKVLLNDEHEATQYHFLLGLTNFLQEKYLGGTYTVEIEREATIQELNTYEIFDYSVNAQHRPPAAGDIYQVSNGEYLVLVGQDCDLIVRGKKITRKVKHAELLKANFKTIHNLEKITDNSKSLEFNYFRNPSETSENYGVLSILFEKPFTSDFPILDLCTFNKDGQSLMNTDSDLTPQISKVIPSLWPDYYEKIKKEIGLYRQHLTLCRDNGLEIDILKTNDMATVDFIEDDNNISYPIRRVCRLKPGFRELLMSNYWEYRRRVGFNTISLIENEKISNIEVKIGFTGQKHFPVTNTQFEAFIQRGNKVKRKDKLESYPLLLDIETLKGEYSILTKIEDNIIFIDKKEINIPEVNIKFTKEVVEENKLLVTITLPYSKEGGNQYLLKERFALKELLNNEYIHLIKGKTSSLYYITDENPTGHFPLYNGGKPIELDVDLLVLGIYIPNLNLKIKIDNGVINLEEFDISSIAKS
ncbi:hypothetical protein [Bacillus sp. V59.32b]|uniref:hypothetical protein n=1 Tax=Bacillus sp. V59.32b TaxID=1758642 RepID=UPI000E3B9B6E|nr:hypothetical protein [Bacillus sp. V59.32b]RFU63611.1 hypothetical protein D0463_11700 [Bacillus sp. V59.32b]